MNRQLMYNSYTRVRGFFNASDFEAKGLPGRRRARGARAAAQQAAGEGLHARRCRCRRRPIRRAACAATCARRATCSPRRAGPTATARCATRRASRSRIEYLDSGGGERLVARPTSRRCAKLGIAGEYRARGLRADPASGWTCSTSISSRCAFPGSEAPGQRAARPLRLEVGRHRRLEQPRSASRIRRSTRWSNLAVAATHAARARRAPARARPRAAPRPLRRSRSGTRAPTASPTARASSSSPTVAPLYYRPEDWVDLHLVDESNRARAMWSYILKRLLLMIPTLFGILLITFVVIQFVPGGPVEQMVAQLQGREAGGEGPARQRQRLPRPPGRRREAHRGDQEALRLRQAGARALRPDARPVRALRPRARASSTTRTSGS